uniref:C2H2-type domain-containing protein n=1 Tax=viral metagenome TaxID=1070528 RepID=A0A6M3LUV7_9ZZZZ
MKRYKCGLCPFETDDLEEMRQHLDTSHDRDAITNPFSDRMSPGLEGVPKKIYRFTPQTRRARDMVKERMTQ